MTTYLVDADQQRKLTGLAKKLGATVHLNEGARTLTAKGFKSERNEEIFDRQAGRFGASVAKPAPVPAAKTVRPAAAKAVPKESSARMGVAKPVGPPSAEEVKATLAEDTAKRDAVLAEQAAELKALKAELEAKKAEQAAEVEATIAADRAKLAADEEAETEVEAGAEEAGAEAETTAEVQADEAVAEEPVAEEPVVDEPAAAAAEEPTREDEPTQSMKRVGGSPKLDEE